MGSGSLTIPCPNCGRAQSEFWCNGQDLLNFVTARVFEYRRCLGCRSLFSADPPTGEALAQYYPGDYGPYRKGEGSVAPSAPTMERLHSILRRLLVDPLARRDSLEPAVRSFYAPPASGNSRMLDFGSGSTTLLNAMREKGWRTSGADFQPSVVEALRAGGHEGYPVGDGLDRLPKDTFDAIRMNHVIEHLQEPRRALATLLKTLKPGGRIHLSTPNGGSLSAAVFKEDWLGLDAPRHLCIFTPAGLKAALEAAGFRDVRIFHEIVSKDAVRSFARLLIRGAARPSTFAKRLSISQANPPLLYPLAFAVARMERSDRIHAFASRVQAP